MLKCLISFLVGVLSTCGVAVLAMWLGSSSFTVLTGDAKECRRFHIGYNPNMKYTRQFYSGDEGTVIILKDEQRYKALVAKTKELLIGQPP